MHCDFCYSPNPTRKYDAGSPIRFRAFVESGPQIGPEHSFDRYWAACEWCGDMIDSGDLDTIKYVVFTDALKEFVHLPTVEYLEWRKTYEQALNALYSELKQRTLIRV